MVDFSNMHKGALRKFARDNGVDIDGLNEDGMRAALVAWQAASPPTEEPVVEPALEQAPPVLTEIPYVLAEPVQEVPTPVIDAVLADVVPVPEVAPPVPEVIPAPVVQVPLPVAKPARLEANGVKQPAVGTICRQIWDYCDTVYGAGEMPKAKALRGWGAGRLDDTTMTIQFYRWRKFRGISGRQA
jgi:hypothetical protein